MTVLNKKYSSDSCIITTFTFKFPITSVLSNTQHRSFILLSTISRECSLPTPQPLVKHSQTTQSLLTHKLCSPIHPRAHKQTSCNAETHRPSECDRAHARHSSKVKIKGAAARNKQKKEGRSRETRKKSSTRRSIKVRRAPRASKQEESPRCKSAQHVFAHASNSFMQPRASWHTRQSMPGIPRALCSAASAPAAS